MGIVFLVAVASLVTFAALKVAKSRSGGGLRRGGWQAVADAGTASADQVRRRGNVSRRRDVF